MGKKGSDRGLLILLAVDDHKYRIEPGYGLEGILPDGKVGDIGRDMVPYLRANDYDGAVTLAVEQVAQVIAADAKVTLSDDEPVQAPPAGAPGTGGGQIDPADRVADLLWRRLDLPNVAGLWACCPASLADGTGAAVVSAAAALAVEETRGGGGFGGFGGGGFGGGGAGGSW